MPTRCNRGFYCRSYCLLNMFRASLCPSSGAQEYYTVVAACGNSCCGFSSSWSGVGLRVMRPVCRMLVYKPLLHLVGILFPHINFNYIVTIISVFFLFCTMTNKYTIISQIITLLHVSTLSCQPQGACIERIMSNF